MVNVNKLKALITERGLTQKQAYEAIGLTKRQWQTRIEAKKMDSDDMLALVELLKPDDPMPIFFASDHT